MLTPLTPEQRAQALARAADARAVRRRLLEDLAAGRRDLATVLRTAVDDPYIGSMTLVDLLRAWAKPGEAGRIVREAGIADRRRLRGLRDGHRAAVVAAVEELRARRPVVPVGGSALDLLRYHFTGSELDPPLGEAGVAAFEAAHGITVPEPYRSFVATVASGCAEGPPAAGLDPLGVDDGDLPARPFPLTAAWAWGDDGDADRELVRRVHRDGFVRLGTDGDGGDDWVLVVTGEQRGRVWAVGETRAEPFDPSAGDPGFAGWVGRWAAGGL